ncbi:hypothetical protein N7474_007856 [Penicillium riverlandense]|uniref:uncharacterized protein n=1 Tax=Penicillium riverlandense TaxID=1903569 RepID=UPI002547B4CB|nr:uncharacterized protein N7474_007856 [Penicillium riverlandense]KAJ5811555.1 hypothetical protein N7474_007856 [Penicillium riverlandense]
MLDMATVMTYWIVLLAAASTALATATTSTLLGVCTTKYGRTSTSRVSTANVFLTVTSHATLATTSTPIKTSTLSPSTITSVVTDTVYSTSVIAQITVTLSTTLTSTSVVTFSETITNTQTIINDITVTSTSTTTIPPSPGFTFASALSTSAIQGPRQTAAAEQNADTQLSKHSNQATALAGGYHYKYNNQDCSKDVDCDQYTTCNNYHIGNCVYINYYEHSLPGFYHFDIFDKHDSLDYRDNLHDKHPAPEATYYAACGPDNQISEINGTTIVAERFSAGYHLQGTNPYDCCVRCLTFSETCTSYSFRAQSAFQSSICYLIAPDNAICDPSENSSQAVILGSGGLDTVGNSNCGSYSLA